MPALARKSPWLTPTRPYRVDWMAVAVSAALAVALISLGLEYGFGQPPVAVGALHLCQWAAVGVVMVDRATRLRRAWKSGTGVRQEAWPLVVIAVGASVLLAIFEVGDVSLVQAATVSVVFVQSFLLLQVVVGVARFNLELSQTGLHPARMMLLGFAGLIILGGTLLSLPVAMTPEHRHEEGPYEAKRVLNCFFTATSAACVTGLAIYDTGADFTPFGQAVILVLIQVGGLGVMIFGSLFGLLVGRQLSLRHSLALQDALSQQTVGDIRRMVLFIVVATFAMEAIGAVLIYPMSSGWAPTVGGRVFYTAFHAISAFCNAGFGLHGDSLVRHARAWPVYVAIMPLIVLGGLGFPVLHDLYQRTRSMIVRRGQRPGSTIRDPFEFPASRPRLHRLSLHSKLALTTSAILIVGGAVLLLAFESTRPWRSLKQVELARLRAGAEGLVGTMADQTMPEKVAAALFQSVTARTAGFNTVYLDEDAMSPASHFLLCALMFVGGSPASTAGGAKTVGTAVLILGVYSTLRGRTQVECFGRTIPVLAVRRASVVVLVMFGLVSLTTLALCYTEAASLQKILFEAASACGTVGLTAGLTTELTVAGRVITMLAMFVGRLGPLTVLIALAGHDVLARYEYPEESPIIG